MSLLGNSVWCDPNIVLLTSCLKRTVDCCESKCLLKIGKKESRQLVADHIIIGVRQIVQDSLGEGHWTDEEECALRKAHCWMFLAWMNTLAGLEKVDGRLTPINTTFYVEVVRSLNFEKFMVQCLCRVTEEAVEILIQQIVNCLGGGCVDEEEEYFLLQFIEHCLKQLPQDLDRLSKVLSIITRGVEHGALQLKIIEKLAQEMSLLLQLIQPKGDSDEESSEKGLNNLGYSVNLFTQKQNAVKFGSNVKWFLNEAKVKIGGFHAAVPVKSVQAVTGSVLEIQDQHSIWKPQSMGISCEVFLHLACCIQRLITVEWKSLFCWGVESTGSPVIQSLKEPDWHVVLFTIFTSCLSLQKYFKDEDEVKRLQGLVDVLKPYFQSQATTEEKIAIDNILNEQEMQKIAGNGLTASEGETDNSLNQELEKAIFNIQENLYGDEKCFEWLLMTEELYQDQRWLKCVLDNAERFVSTTVVKMFIDVLCVLYESASQDSDQWKFYKSLQQVILKLMPCLSLEEQVEIIVYNFDQICLHFKSYTDESYFFLPDDPSACMSGATKLLTVTMNKIVYKVEESFSQDVLTGITKGALIAPYITLKALLTEAVKHSGYEKVICKFLQMMPQFAGLCSAGGDYLLVRALNEILKTLSSKKQEGNFLKLIAALLQPYSHPVLSVKEPPLLAARVILKKIIKPLLTVEDNGDVSPTLVLNILLTTLSCSKTTPLQHHWILDERPFEVLFILLEMYQDCIHFWQDWISDGGGNVVMDRDDFALDEAWTEMNVAVKILDEHFIPLLAEDISQEPNRYASSHSEWMESQLDNLDWTASMQLIPLLQQNNVMSRGIKLPKSLVHLITCQLNVLPLDDTEAFWTMYLKSGAVSNEVFGMYFSKLKDHHPRGTGNDGDCKEIVESLASILPFSTWFQWQRLLNIGRELLENGYLDLKKEKWTTELVVLPEVDNLDASSHNTIDISFLLMSILHCISTKVWATTYVWNTTLQNYVSTMKQLSLSVEKPHEFVVTCHLLAHLAYIAFKIVPEGFHENVAIVTLDVFNACLSTIPNVQDKDLKPFEYIQGIIDTIPSSELRKTMVNKIQRVVSNNAK